MTAMTEQELDRAAQKAADTILLAYADSKGRLKAAIVRAIKEQFATTQPVAAAEPTDLDRAVLALPCVLPELDETAIDDTEASAFQAGHRAALRQAAALVAAAPVQAATDEVRDKALEALLTRIDDAWANYERMGEACPFDGQPMIYASTLEEIVELRRALRTTSTEAQAATPADSQKGSGDGAQG